MQCGVAIFNVFENYSGEHLGDLNTTKVEGRKCIIRDNREIIQCCMLTIDTGREVGMA